MSLLCDSCSFKAFRDDRDGGLAPYCTRTGGPATAQLSEKCADPKVQYYERREEPADVKAAWVSVPGDPIPDPDSWRAYDSHNVTCLSWTRESDRTIWWTLDGTTC